MQKQTNQERKTQRKIERERKRGKLYSMPKLIWGIMGWVKLRRFFFSLNAGFLRVLMNTINIQKGRNYRLDFPNISLWL